ncbi:hypothetical protein ACHAXT_003571 [Thalassiosira profunda]
MSQSAAARALLLGDGSKPPKLEYFAIEGAAEPVRIALSIAGVPFEDATFPFSEWAAKKPTTKYGVLPELTLPDGTIVTESMAMLRLAGEADPEGKLYPADLAKRVKVESVLGLTGDMSRAWRPALYIGMRPQALGHPPKEEWSDMDATVKKLRTDFLAEQLPQYAGYFTDLISESGGKFLTGEDLTIADISAYQAFRYFTRGVADHVPKDSLEKFPELVAWMKRFEAHPKVAAYKASK